MDGWMDGCDVMIRTSNCTELILIQNVKLYCNRDDWFSGVEWQGTLNLSQRNDWWWINDNETELFADDRFECWYIYICFLRIMF